MSELVLRLVLELCATLAVTLLSNLVTYHLSRMLI